MSETSIPMTLPLDTEGFLRRECPHCERQFKWQPAEDADDGAESIPSRQVVAYYCPYCYQAAPPDAWWTQEQLKHAQQLMMSEVLAPQLRRFGRQGRQTSHSNSFVKIDVSVPDFPIPEPLVEPSDMIRVDFPCHPEEPLKVIEDWTAEVGCLVCGIRYPLDLVRELPHSSEEEAE